MTLLAEPNINSPANVYAAKLRGDDREGEERLGFLLGNPD